MGCGSLVNRAKITHAGKAKWEIYSHFPWAENSAMFRKAAPYQM